MDQTSVQTPAAQRPAPETNVKETIESILVAFILAFMFRAFVVEAFVIPTGSMAPTLLGAHLQYICDDCGYEFEVNYQSPDSDGDDVSIPATARLTRPARGPAGQAVYDKTYRIHCPNCGYRVPRFDPDRPQYSATNPPVHYGDRILVLKYLYLLQSPRRWDVVVFKSPNEPEKYDYTQNYIKRLVGKPGESIMVLDGDIYVSTKGENSTAADFVVQTKPRWAQEALWRIVFDNDFQPRGRSRVIRPPAGDVTPQTPQDPPFVQPWTPTPGEMGWDLSAGRVFEFNNSQGGATLTFNPEASPNTHPLTDWLAYDISINQNGRDPGGREVAADTYETGGYEPDNNVSDVKLAMYYQRKSGEGPLRLILTKLDDTFIAEITTSQARLIRRGRDGADQVLATAPMPSDSSRPVRLEFQNVDYEVTLRVNDRDLLKSTPQQYSPDVQFLLNAYSTYQPLPKPRVAISADRQVATISHLSLWRDVYYTNRRNTDQSPRAAPRSSQRPPPLLWATPEEFPRHVMHLGPDEYFVCGDNSLISGDARYWDRGINLPHEDLRAQPGVVPGRFLLGKAFFVYWPAGFRPLRGESVPALVPNFGRMRFIH